MTSFVNEGILPREVGLTEVLFGMNLTPYHSKLFAHELTKRSPSDSNQELQEKFFLPCAILKSKSYNDTVRQGHVRPFECDLSSSVPTGSLDQKRHGANVMRF